METGDQYGQPDLQQFLASRTQFPATLPQPSEPYLAHRNMAPLASYREGFMLSNGMAMPSGLVRFSDDHFRGGSATSAIFASASGPCAARFGVEMENNGWSLRIIDGGNSRWPRQETLTLLEIRSRLDFKFKEATNQKGHLWDEVSRIMAVEHGYQRCGKKCKEKFENLYKYYKKTKEGKAGRQDGKNYRFFRQLEALYGETSNQSSVSETNLTQRTLLCQTLNNAMNQENHQESLQEPKISESLSFSNASEFEISSAENNDEDLSAIAFMMKQPIENQKSGSSSRVKKGWKTKVKDFVESEMKKLTASQDVWMEKMLKTIEDKEQEMMSKEEERRRQETAQFYMEHEFWVKERASVEARDDALMEILKKFTGKGVEVSFSAEAPVTKNQDEINTKRWTEHEISSLIQFRISLEPRFQETTGNSKESLWEEIEAKMVSLGHEREAVECKEKWDNMQMYFNVTNAECCKKRKEDFLNSNYFQRFDSFDCQENKINTVKRKANQSMDSSASSSYNTNSFGIVVNQADQCFWDRYRLKLSKGKNKQI